MPDKIRQAKIYGYNNPFTLMNDEYENGKSTSQVGKMLKMDRCAIRYHLVRMGVKMRPQGGPNNSNCQTKVDQFSIICLKCQCKFMATSFSSLILQLKQHKCG